MRSDAASVTEWEDSQAIKEPGPWFEIIGVVRDLVPDPEAPMSLDNPARPVVYHTLGSNRTQSYPLYLATHVRSGDPTSVLPTLRRIAAEISPELRLSDIQRLDQGTSYDARAWNGIADFILLVSAIALVLSLAGIYAMTSFTVSRRTREIAVRVALGAQVSNVVTNVFRGPFFQVAMGVAVGCLHDGGPGRAIPARFRRGGRHRDETCRAAPRVWNDHDGRLRPRLHRTASAGIPGGADRCTQGRWIARAIVARVASTFDGPALLIGYSPHCRLRWP